MSDPVKPAGDPPAAVPTPAPTTPVAAAPVAPAASPPAPKRNPWAGPPRAVAAAPPPPPLPALGEAPAPSPAASKPSGRETKQVALQQAEIAKLKADLRDARGEASVIEEYATTELAGLTDEQKALVLEFAGKSPKAQLAKIREYRKAGLFRASAPVVPSGATTATTGAPPAASANDPDVIVFRQWEQAKRSGSQQLAARLFATNSDAINRGRAKAAPSN